MASRRHTSLAGRMASLLSPAEALPEAANDTAEGALPPMGGDLLANLPVLLSAAELAAWLDVSPETIRRRIRAGRQPTIEVLGIKRVTAASAVEQVRDRVVARLPGRYRSKSGPCATSSADGKPRSPTNSDSE